jgi:hypothetical protein
MSYFINRFLDQKLLYRERLLIWIIVMVENPILGLTLWAFSLFQYKNIPAEKYFWYVILYLNIRGSTLFQHFHRFCEISEDHFFHHRPHIRGSTWTVCATQKLLALSKVSGSTVRVSRAFLPNFILNFILIPCCKVPITQFETRHRKTHVISEPQPPRNCC